MLKNFLGSILALAFMVIIFGACALDCSPKEGMTILLTGILMMGLSGLGIWNIERKELL